MKHREDIETEIVKGKINKQLNDALLAIRQMDNTKLADRLLYDLSLCYLGGGYLSYRKSVLYPLCVNEPKVASNMANLNLIGYLLTDKLDQNNLIQTITNEICAKHKINTLKEINELKQDVKRVIREIFIEMQQHNMLKEHTESSSVDSYGYSSNKEEDKSSSDEDNSSRQPGLKI